MDFDKTNIENLTNDELFKLFKKNGLMCGPINQTTRSVYSKKIIKFINEKNQVSNNKLAVRTNDLSKGNDNQQFKNDIKHTLIFEKFSLVKKTYIQNEFSSEEFVEEFQNMSISQFKDDKSNMNDF